MQRLVHNILLIFTLLLFGSTFAQNKIGKKEIIVLNKIIEDSRQKSTLTSYLIAKPTILNEGNLKNYYEYRYEGKIKGKIVLDIVNDSLIYDTDENNKAFAKIYNQRY